MHTYFASPERTSKEQLDAEIDFASHNPVISGLLDSVGGLLAVLDEQRQIVAINAAFLHILGVDDPARILGLRPGEALQCIHAREEQGGCGTSKFCSSCGAAIAIVSSLDHDKPAERICALSAVREGKALDLALLVRSKPIRIEERRFLLLFVQDITTQQQRAALERTFFHDINSMLGMLAGAAELMAEESQSELTETVRRTSMRLSKEVAVHRILLKDPSADCQPNWAEISVEEVLAELRAFFSVYAASPAQKRISFPERAPAAVMRTDLSLLMRVLCNMITNALEASAADLESGVRVWIEQEEGRIAFCVWNGQEIHPDTARRVFQLYFSTKAGDGRGIGTYSMKLIGEKILGGTVSFTTSKEAGTMFRFSAAARSR